MKPGKTSLGHTHRNVDKAIANNGKEQYAAFDSILTSNGQPWNITPNL